MTTEDDIRESSGKLDELWAGAKYTNVNTPSGNPYSNGREEDVNGHKIAMKTTTILCQIKKDIFTMQQTEQGLCKNHIISIHGSDHLCTNQLQLSSATICNYSYYPHKQKF